MKMTPLTIFIVVMVAAGLAIFWAVRGHRDAAAALGDTATCGNRVNAAEAATLISGPDRPAGLVVLDVRTPDEFAAGHLPGARNLDVRGRDFAQGIRDLDPNGIYLVYCRTQNRSGLAKTLMHREGIVDVRLLNGGYTAWQQGGFPIEGGR